MLLYLFGNLNWSFHVYLLYCTLTTTQLAELKTIFDRFAVEGAMTAPETCQALTEAGVIVPRR